MKHIDDCNGNYNDDKDDGGLEDDDEHSGPESSSTTGSSIPQALSLMRCTNVYELQWYGSLFFRMP